MKTSLLLKLFVFFSAIIFTALFVQNPIFAQEKPREGIDYCSAPWLEKFFGKEEAGNAAQICEKASKGTPYISTTGNENKEKDCLQGGSEFGVGLFLINIYKTDLAPGVFKDGGPPCVIADQGKLSEVAGKLLYPDINARTAAQLYKNNVDKGNCGWAWSSVAKELKIPCTKTSIAVSRGENLASAGQTGISEEAVAGVPPEEEEKEKKVKLGIAEQIANFYQWALGIGGLLALGVLIFGGILYVISAGNASRQEEAKSWLLGAVMGILLLFGSYLILNTINPELTKLKDLELIVNKAAQFKEPRVYTPPFSGPDCGGVYITGSKTADKGNFGDPACEAQAGANPQYRQALASLLQEKDPSNALHWYKTVIPCETRPDGEYNPNAFNPDTPQATGGWGLFQMGSVGRSNPRYDFGNKPWREQVDNAVNLLRENSSRYWECW